MSQSEPSVFTRIIDREIPADIVYEDDQFIAFTDIAPKAPIHIVIVPKTPEYANVVELAAGDPGLLAQMVARASTVAHQVSDGQFRLVFNTGTGAGQTIFHVHGHIMSGELTEGSLGR